jgi:hypothetical protein
MPSKTYWDPHMSHLFHLIGLPYGSVNIRGPILFDTAMYNRNLCLLHSFSTCCCKDKSNRTVQGSVSTHHGSSPLYLTCNAPQRFTYSDFTSTGPPYSPHTERSFTSALMQTEPLPFETDDITN